MEALAIWLRDVLLNGFIASGVFPASVRSRWLRLMGVRLHPTARVMPGCFIGGRNLTMGEESWLYYDCHVETSADVVLGSHVSISTGVRLVTATHDLGPSDDRLGPDRSAPIVIEDGCWVGIGATVLGGVTIGRGCVIAAGAMVSKDCAPNGLYVGAPVARRIRELDEDGPRRSGGKHGERPRRTVSGVAVRLTSRPGSGANPENPTRFFSTRAHRLRALGGGTTAVVCAHVTNGLRRCVLRTDPTAPSPPFSHCR